MTCMLETREPVVCPLVAGDPICPISRTSTCPPEGDPDCPDC